MRSPGSAPVSIEARSRSHHTATLFKLIVAAVVLLQRFAIPFGDGEVPLVLPLVLILVVWSLQHGVLVREPLRLQLCLLALTWCAGMAAVASWRGLDWSALSIIYLVLTYLPFAFHLREPDPDAFRQGLVFFLALMTVAAVVGIAQMGAQLVGWAYGDPFSPLPRRFVLQGYVTSYPIVYGSGIYKANGIWFLEPSFYSQFLGLAVVVHLYLRRRGPALYLYLLGLVAAVSGTGILLVIAGTLALGLSRLDKHFVRLIAVFVAAGVAVALSPVGSIFAFRLQEAASGRGSAEGRFSTPYEITASALSDDAISVLSGKGPGAADRLSGGIEEKRGLDAVFPVVPKLALEYGLPAVAVFLWFIMTSALMGVPSLPLSVSVLFMYLTLSGSLLQPTTVYTLFAFTSLFSRSPAFGRARQKLPV